MNLQRVTLIGIRGGGGPFDPSGREEAVELRIGSDGEIEVDAVRRLLEAIRPENYTYQDTRRHTNWGATGLESQTIEVMFLIAVGAQLTADVLRSVLGRAVGSLAGPEIDSAEAAWEVFGEFLTRAFEVDDPKLVSVVQQKDGWRLEAKAGGHDFEGRITDGGHVLEARRR